MVKHVYYKKQATDGSWHSVAKMDKQAQLNRRREIALKKREQDRKHRIVLEYFNIKYPVLYQEAIKYYTDLNQQYPNVKDLRKTAGFKHFKATTTSTDTMVLKIPMVNIQNEAKGTLPEGTSVEINTNAEETIDTIFPDINTNAEETIDTIFPDIDMNDLVSEIPQQFIDNIIQDLRADPNLRELMDEVEDQVNKETEEEKDPDIDIEFENDDSLENELW